MSLSFQEKSLWLMLVSLLGVFGLYFREVLPVTAQEVLPHQVVLFCVAVAALVVIQIVGHAAIAIVDRRSGTDERDRLIALLGTRNGSYALATGVFLALCIALLFPGNFIFTHVLLACWVLSQLVEIATQLYLQRRGV